VRLPPLRERIEDLPDLIGIFSCSPEDGLRRRSSDALALGAPQAASLARHVRELENLARRLAALYPQDVITGSVIDGELAPPA